MELLFDNPFLLIIIIAALSSFFKKKKEDPNHKKNVPGAGQRQTTSESPFNEVREIFKEVSRKLSDEASIPPRRIESEVFIEKPVLDKVPVAQNVTKGDLINEASLPTQLPLKGAKEKKLEVNANQIIDSVIWSEILGSPRAKKPYEYKNIRR